MFRQGPVTWSRIQGGICAYLLLGMAWASAFNVVEQLHPGAFHFVTEPANIDQLTSNLIYFSFATLTTVGFWRRFARSSLRPLSGHRRSHRWPAFPRNFDRRSGRHGHASPYKAD